MLHMLHVWIFFHVNMLTKSYEFSRWSRWSRFLSTLSVGFRVEYVWIFFHVKLWNISVAYTNRISYSINFHAGRKIPQYAQTLSVWFRVDYAFDNSNPIIQYTEIQKYALDRIWRYGSALVWLVWHRCSQFHLWICWESINASTQRELSAFLFPSLSIMGLGLLLFLYDIGGCNSSPHLYVENLSTHSELSAFLFPSVCFCMTLVTLVTLVFAIHLSHVENLSTQSELSAFFFPSLRLGRLGRYYRRRCVTVFVLI